MVALRKIPTFYSPGYREGVFSETTPLPTPEMPGRVILSRTNRPGPGFSSLFSPSAPFRALIHRAAEKGSSRKPAVS